MACSRPRVPPVCETLITRRKSQCGSREQLPESIDWGVERGGRFVVHGAEAQGEGSRKESDKQGLTPARPPDRRQQQGPEEIELFFDAERPEVQQWLGAGCLIEVAGLVPIEQVRDEPCGPGDVLSQSCVFSRQEQ